MKTKPISLIGTILIALLCHSARAQMSATASAVWINNCTQTNFLNTSGTIGPSPLPANLGAYTQNSSTLLLSGAQVNTSHDTSSSNVCTVTMYYNVHLQSSPAGAFTPVNLPLLETCNGSNQFPSDGSSCAAGDQRWQSFFPATDLTAMAAGNYVLEIYYQVTGSNSSKTLCNDVITLDNGGTNYKSSFSIQSPNLSSTNPSSCFGNQGSITIGGLIAGAIYQLSYTDDGTPVGPNTYTANGSGQVVITGLKKGFYSDFTLQINNCTTNLYTGVILSDPIFVPTFTSIAPFCAGTPAPILPTTSNNGIKGSWNPSVVNNLSSGTYTFTPDSNQCGRQVTMNITVIQRTTPTFIFGTNLTTCGGGSVPTLPSVSSNSIPGSWSPSVVDNQNSATYIFTPNAGQCATQASFTVVVNQNIIPTFSFGTSQTMCAGTMVPSLPTKSQNGIDGSWNPLVVDDQNSGVYTFTPSAGQCATTQTFTVTVNPNVTPLFLFGPNLSICAGGSVPALPTVSQNGIAGKWSPTVVDNQNSATYTFTPTVGQCATPTTFVVTVSPNVVPTFSFGPILSICAGGSVPVLPSLSMNNISGIWVPSVVDNQASGNYLFIPNAGQCATTASFSVTVSPNITPSFPFGTNLTICAGASVPVLPGTSSNAIIGTWSPSTVSNQSSGVYTFTPRAGQCATSTTFSVTVNPNITPLFSFGPSLSICAGASVPVLPGGSTNGINGTWSPSVVSNQVSGIYTFTPTAGQCATSTTFSVTVNANITPTFSFGTSVSICAGSAAPALPTGSMNGISGTWSPSSIDNQNSATYTFTPNSGQCAVSTSLAVTVNPNLAPLFAFGASQTICAGAPAPVLPGISTNNITGSWTPAVVDNQNSGSYTFTPDPGQCATGPVTFSVTVTPNAVPVFSFGPTLTICAGGNVPVLPITSDNSIAGSWNPPVVSNQASGVYTFSAGAGQCVLPYTYTVTVNPIIKPSFSFGTLQSLCIGSTVPVLSDTSTNGIKGTWSPATIDNTVNGTYLFTPDSSQCADTTSFTLEVNAVPSSTIRDDTTVYDGNTVPGYNFTVSTGATVHWSNSDASIGLAGSGTGDLPPFIAKNMSNQPVSATISATPIIGGCSGATQSYVVKVLPLNKDVFVPNVFTPNGDGKNDLLYAYGNYIDKIDMHIFNQWGQQIAVITDKTQGWDGNYKGSPQPVGVYVYVLKASLSDGRAVNMKGSITLLR